MSSNDGVESRKSTANRRRSETDRRQLKEYAWLDRMERRASKDDRRSGPVYKRRGPQATHSGGPQGAAEKEFVGVEH